MHNIFIDLKLGPIMQNTLKRLREVYITNPKGNNCQVCSKPVLNVSEEEAEIWKMLSVSIVKPPDPSTCKMETKKQES